MQCHWCWCQCHTMPTMSSFHLLGQDDQKEMQHYLFGHVMPKTPSMAPLNFKLDSLPTTSMPMQMMVGKHDFSVQTRTFHAIPRKRNLILNATSKEMVVTKQPPCHRGLHATLISRVPVILQVKWSNHYLTHVPGNLINVCAGRVSSSVTNIQPFQDHLLSIVLPTKKSSPLED